MATLEYLAKAREEAVVATNEVVASIVGKLNDFLPTDRLLEAFSLAIAMPKHGDPFVREVKQQEQITAFLQAVDKSLDSMIESIKANQKLADELIELQAKLNESADPENEIETESETIEIDPESSDLESPESSETGDQEAGITSNTAKKRGRPKK